MRFARLKARIIRVAKISLASWNNFFLLETISIFTRVHASYLETIFPKCIKIVTIRRNGVNKKKLRKFNVSSNSKDAFSIPRFFPFDLVILLSWILFVRVQVYIYSHVYIYMLGESNKRVIIRWRVPWWRFKDKTISYERVLDEPAMLSQYFEKSRTRRNR